MAILDMSPHLAPASDIDQAVVARIDVEALVEGVVMSVRDALHGAGRSRQCHQRIRCGDRVVADQQILDRRTTAHVSSAMDALPTVSLQRQHDWDL